MSLAIAFHLRRHESPAARIVGMCPEPTLTRKPISEKTYREVAGFRGIISKKTAEEIWVGTIKTSYFDPKINLR